MDIRPVSASDVEARSPQLLSFLMRNLTYIIVITSLISLVAYQIVDAIAPRYTAQTTVLIDTGAADSSATVLDREVIAGQAQLIRSRDLARTVANALDLAGRPEFDPALRRTTFLQGLLGALGLTRNPGDRSIEERVLESYEERLSVYPLDGSRVIAVDFTSADPELAALAANTVAERYVAMQEQARDAAAAVAGDAIAAEIVALRERLRDAEAKVEARRARNGMPADADRAPPSPEVADRSTELAQLRAQQADARARADRIRDAIEAGNVANLAESLSAPLITRLVEQQADLRARIAEESATALPQHPRMKGLAAQLADLDRQMDEEAGRMLSAAEAEVRQAAGREQEILDGLSATEIAAVDAGEGEVELRQLEGEAAELRAALDARLARYREALSDQQVGFLPVDARILSRAVAPIEASYPRPAATTAVVAAVVFFLAILVVLARERSRRRSIRRAAFDEPMPVLAGDGSIEEGDQGGWEAGGAPTLVPEVVDRVSAPLTAIARRIADEGAKCVLITLAADSGEDSRPLAGVALARALVLDDARVVLVDLRDDGESSRSMGEGDDVPGFSDLFAGDASFAQVIVRDRQSRVHYIPAGRGSIRPETLAGERLDTLLSALTLTYDVVLLDAPDALVRVLAPEAALVVVVSDYGPSDARTVRAIDRLQGVPAAVVALLVADRGPEPGGGEAAMADHHSSVEAA